LVATALWNLCIGIGVVLVVVIALQVFTRYALGWVPLWGGELSRYLAIWIALLLTPVFVWQDRHLQVEIIFQKLSRRGQRLVRSGQLLVILAVGFMIADWGIVYAVENGFGQTSPSMDFQMFWVYLGLPISGTLIILFTVAKLIEIHRHPETLEEDYRSRFKLEEEPDPSVTE
jgi:TRAP-type C4-dicarboxylate transport system permease small subunit